VGKKEGEQKGSARGSVHWGCYYATALDIECLILRTPSRAPYRTPPACTKRATYPPPTPVVPGLTRPRLGIHRCPSGLYRRPGPGAAAVTEVNQVKNQLRRPQLIIILPPLASPATVMKDRRRLAALVVACTLVLIQVECAIHESSVECVPVCLCSRL
jgi:hypothetical protein